MSIWKHNNFFIGITVALVLTAMSILLIILTAPFIYRVLNFGIPNPKFLLLSIIPAVIMMRYYMKILQFGKSGNGVLLTVFAFILLYFLVIAKNITEFPSFF